MTMTPVKHMTRSILMTMTVLLSGCGLYQNPGNPPMNQIQTTLNQHIQNDRAITQHAINGAIPSDVNNALLPTLSLNGQGVSPVSQRFDIDVSNMPARTFFMGLIKDTPYNIIISPDLSGNISLSLKQVTVQQVLDAVRDIYGYRYQYTPYGFEVFPSGLQTRIFTVNYLDMQRYGQSYTNVLSGELTENEDNANNSNTSNAPTTSSGTGTSPQPTSNNGSQSGSPTNGMPLNASSSINTYSKSDFWHTLKESLETIIGKDTPGTSVVLNPSAGLVIVRATPAQLQEVSQYLDQTQSSMNRQVIIDTQILEVTLDNGYQAGIDWNLLGFKVSTLSALPGNLGSFSQAFTLTGSADNGNFQEVIGALETQGNVQVLSNPRISTMNNQASIIKVGEDQYFTTGFNTSFLTNANGGIEGTTQSVSIQPFFSGIALEVTPQIDSHGLVTLHIHPLVSTVTADSQTFQLGTLSNGDPNDSVVNLALSKVRESDSIVRARSGQVIVLGGLMENKVDEEVGGVPLLDQIPYLGSLFRRTYQTSTKTELVILMRPIVVDDQTWVDQLEDIKGTYEGLEQGFHLGSDPARFGNMAETEYFDQFMHKSNVTEGQKTLEAARQKASTTPVGS